MSDYHLVHIPLLTVCFPGSFLSVSPLESSFPAVTRSNSAITTVGYGEITPRSFLGRLITIPILVFGLLLITLPSFVLGREFSLVWERMISKKVSPCYPLLFCMKFQNSISKMVKAKWKTNRICLPIKTLHISCTSLPQAQCTPPRLKEWGICRT